MAGKAGKHNPEDSRLGTFNIKHQTWQDFLQLCGEHKTSATKALVSFIESCVESQSIPDDGKLPDIDIDSLIDAKLESITAAIAGLGCRLEALEKAKPKKLVEAKYTPTPKDGEEPEPEPVKVKPKEGEGAQRLPKGTPCPAHGITSEEMAKRQGVKPNTVEQAAAKCTDPATQTRSFDGKQWYSPKGVSWWIPVSFSLSSIF